VTIGDLLEVVDPDGTKNVDINIKDNNDIITAQIKTSSMIWDYIGNRDIKRLGANGVCIDIWLE
jgi:hypothetical protein